MRAVVIGSLVAAVLAGVFAACPPEDFPIVAVPPDFDTIPTASTDAFTSTGTTEFFDVGTGTFDTAGGSDIGSGSGGYYDDIRPRLAACVACHGADGPVAPALHSYVALRNSVDAVLRALADGHDGNFSRLAPDCDVASDAHIADLASVVARWRDSGFPNGTPVPPPPDPVEPPPPTTTLTVGAWANVPGARCYALGAVPGDLGRLRVDATGLAWVELYALAPQLADARAAAESADAAPGWSCGSDLALVPQPLVALWQLGQSPFGTPTAWPLAPLRTASGATLVARVASLPTPASGTPVPRSLAVDLWVQEATPDATVYVPLRTGVASTAFPWTGAAVHTAGAESEPDVELLEVDRPAQSALCAQTRFCTSSPCDPPPTWPGATSFASELELAAGARLSLRCADDGPCGAQVALVGDFAHEPCDATARACAATCAGDLSCIEACGRNQDDRCALCVITSQLACREAACPDGVALASGRLEACATATDPAACITTTVFTTLDVCTAPAPPLCAAALSACGL